MINAIQDYLETVFPNITFGQIQDIPDNLLNMNIIDSGRKPFFNDEKSHILSVSLYVRNSSFENMQNKNGEVSARLLNIYDTIIPGVHIVDTKQTGSEEPFRDSKNRYYQLSSFEMLVEKI